MLVNIIKREVRRYRSNAVSFTESRTPIGIWEGFTPKSKGFESQCKSNKDAGNIGSVTNWLLQHHNSVKVGTLGNSVNRFARHRSDFRFIGSFPSAVRLLYSQCNSPMLFGRDGNVHNSLYPQSRCFKPRGSRGNTFIRLPLQNNINNPRGSGGNISNSLSRKSIVVTDCQCILVSIMAPSDLSSRHLPLFVIVIFDILLMTYWSRILIVKPNYKR